MFSATKAGFCVDIYGCKYGVDVGRLAEGHHTWLYPIDKALGELGMEVPTAVLCHGSEAWHA